MQLIDELEHILVATPSEEISEKETKMYKQASQLTVISDDLRYANR